MSSTGSGRGVIYTVNDYSHFRLQFTMRHISGNPDHQACVLIFCSRPRPGEKPLDALGGIQFQVPKGGHWDYHPGMNNDGGREFTKSQNLPSTSMPGAASRLSRMRRRAPPACLWRNRRGQKPSRCLRSKIQPPARQVRSHGKCITSAYLTSIKTLRLNWIRRMTA
jgi:hypothetical protein